MNTQYELADSRIWQEQHDIFKHCEIMFKPDLYGLERDGIHRMIHATIQKCDPSIHSELYSNIVLAGGNTTLPGIIPRLTNELKKLAPKYNVRFKEDRQENRIHRTFKGASYMSGTPFWRNHLWINRYEYDESGVENILEKQNPLGFY